jgi:heparan-sulfate lyase
MMNLKKIILLLTLAPTLLFAQQQSNPVTKDSFSNLNLNYPGLEEVNKFVAGNDYENAAKALLKYYRKRDNIKHPEYNTEDKAKFAGKKLAEGVQEKADKGMLHQFYVHPGYGFIDYGKDINWQHWPIKDNEIRWQLHRTYWWQPMGLAYWSSGDEKYAKEWIFQFRDWVKKNPKGLSKENDRFAWRPLEVSTRIQDQTGTFNMFVNSPNFTPDFLLEFLNIYNQQADHILNNYSDKGNHLLFEAQRIIYAGCFFPELKAADSWRKSGIEILNTEIKKQIYPDGLHFELSPNYHVATINIFLKALHMTQLTGMSNEFPESYKKTVEEMIIALADFSFPDYSYPMFGDAKLAKKDEMLKQYKEWRKVYPKNQVIKYFATEGKQGTTPAYLSSALKTGGFYTFRNDWKENATVMVLRASPPGFFHSQPDNGTFDLWVKGRNFMPDAGAYVYSGSEEIQKLREAYRQTKVHKTLTLDNNNMDVNDAKLMTWKASPAVDLLVYNNSSYKALNHRRSVLFIDKKYFVIIDEAVGAAKGNVGIHFQLAEDSKAAFNKKQNSVQTQYKDGNNLLIQTFGKGAALTEEEGKVSYSYRKEIARPAFAFEKAKNNDNTVSFTTVLYPFEGAKAPIINVKEGSKHNLEKGTVDLTLTIDGKKHQISEQLY